MNRQRCFSVVLSLLFGLLPAASLRAAEPVRDMVLASSPETMRTPDGLWLQLIYTDALKRLGYRLVVPEWPMARGAAMADQGLVDGLLQRAAFYQDTDPQLLRVPEHHFTVRFVAYGLKPAAGLHGWPSLKNRGLRVECRRGILVCEAQARRYAGEENVSISNSTELGLRKLVHGRTDLFIDSRYSVEGQLEHDEFRNAGVRALGVMDEQTMHVYLNRKHAELVPRLSAVLHQMKEDGLVEKYRIQAGRAPL